MKLCAWTVAATLASSSPLLCGIAHGRSSASLSRGPGAATPAQFRTVLPEVIEKEGLWWLPAATVHQFGFRGVSPGEKGSRLAATMVKVWPSRGNMLTIVLLGLDVRFGCVMGPTGFVVGILDDKGKLRARSDEITSYGDHLGGSAGHKIAIDTGRYRISDDEQAFGVRLQHGDHDVRNCFDDEVLHLFRVVGDKVVRILTTDAGYQQVTEEDEEMKPDCYQWVYKGTFRMLPTKTLGFYEIERRMINGVRTVVYRWNGSGYEMVGPDPIDHTIRRRFDECTGLPSCFSGHADCEHRPGYPWERAPKATDIKSAESPKNPDAR